MEIHSSRMREETRQAYTMFGVVALFVFGHGIRIALNIKEFYISYIGNDINPAEEKECRRGCASYYPLYSHVRKNP